MILFALRTHFILQFCIVRQGIAQEIGDVFMMYLISYINMSFSKQCIFIQV